MTDQDNVYNCDDENLGQMLARLFSEGHDSVEIQHPVDGPIIITRAEFLAHVSRMDKVLKMSPADRIVANKKIKNQKKSAMIKLGWALCSVEIETIDADDDTTFAKDIDGKELDIDGMTFIAVQAYPANVEPVKQELGAFVDEKGKRPPVRIKQKDE